MISLGLNHDIDGCLRISRQPYGTNDVPCHVGSIKVHRSSVMTQGVLPGNVWAYGTCTNQLLLICRMQRTKINC